MMDFTTARARPLVEVGYGPRSVPLIQLAEAARAALDWRDGSGDHIDGVVGSTDNEEQLQTANRVHHLEVTVTYTDVRH